MLMISLLILLLLCHILGIRSQTDSNESDPQEEKTPEIPQATMFCPWGMCQIYVCSLNTAEAVKHKEINAR